MSASGKGKWPLTGVGLALNRRRTFVKQRSSDAGSAADDSPALNYLYGPSYADTMTPAAVGATSSIPQPSGWFVTVTTDVQILDGNDDATYNSGAFSKTQTWQWIGTSTDTSTGAWTGFRFLIPTAVAAADITNVALNLYTFDGTGTTATAAIRVEQGPASQLVGSGSLRPDTLWGTIGAGNQVNWTHVGAAADAANTSPDISASVKSALALIDQSTEYVGVMVGPTGVGTSRYRTWSKDDGTAGRLPKLTITEVKSVNNVMRPDAVAAVAAIPDAVASSAYTIDYTNGTALVSTKDRTDAGSRTGSLWLPTGVPSDYGHTDGWPIALWIHGGFFQQGSRGQCPMTFVDGCLARGYAVFAPDYRLTEAILGGAEVVANGNEASFPLGIHDVKVAIRYFTLDKLGANTYNVDTTKVLLTGHSAGTSIASFVAFTKGDTSTYNGIYPGSWPSAATFPPQANRWYRPAHVNRSNTSSYPFDFHQNGDTVSTKTLDDFTPIGLFMFAPAISLQNGVDAAKTPDTDARYFISLGRRYYVSKSSSGTIDTTVYGEMDVDKYINPASGTPTNNEPYLGKADVVPTFPIGVVQGTSDILTPKAAQYDALVTALTNVGYIGSAPTTGATNHTGLSYYEIATDHDGARTNATGISYFFDWLDNITAEATGGTATPSVVTATSTIPAPALAQSLTPTAVASVAAIPAPARGAGWVLSTVVSTSTIPVPGWGAVKDATVVAATSTIPSAGWGTTKAATVVAATSTIPAPGWGTTKAATVVASTSTTPAPTWGAGWVLSAVSAVCAIPAPTRGAGIGATVVVALAATPSVSWGSGWLLSTIAATSAITAPSLAAGGSASPTVVAATSTIPAPSRGAGWVLSSVTASTTIPTASISGGGLQQPTVVAATSTIPAPGLGQTIAPAAVAAVAAIPAPTAKGGGQVSPAVVVAVTAIAAQAGVGGGFTTPAVTASTSTIPAPTIVYGARIVPSVVASTATVPTPQLWAGVSAVAVTATTTIPSPSFITGGTSAASVVAATTTIPSAGWGRSTNASVVAATSTIPAPTFVVGGYVAASTVTSTTAIGTPGLTSGTKMSPTVVPVTTAVGAPIVVGGGAASVQPIAALAAVPSPLITGGGVASVMALMATVMVGFATVSKLHQTTISWSDGTNEIPCSTSYYDGTGEKPFTLEWVE